MNKEQRPLDVVVWGATGFTGRLVAEHLAARRDDKLRWAIAGRSAERLSAVKDSLGSGGTTVDTIVADSFDRESLDTMAAQTRAVISTVGPYAKYGSLLVAACAQQGTDYCDLAGEAQWVRRMIDQHQSEAESSGARIVHCCGFDSVPMDVGVWFLQQQAMRRHEAHCESITMLVKATKGGPSGGTIASMLNLIEEARKDRAVARVLADPYGLNPANERSGPDDRDQRRARFDTTVSSWTAPFVMAGINTRVVRRSHALLGYPYGKAFRYHEAVLTGSGTRGRMKAMLIAAGLAGVVLGGSFAATRRLLQRFVFPEPGEGPDRATRESGFFDLRQFGRLPSGTLIKSRITGDRDPGYGSTSKMLGECGVCLAQDNLPTSGGVHTPVSAMAAPLYRRLVDNAGLSFEVID